VSGGAFEPVAVQIVGDDEEELAALGAQLRASGSSVSDVQAVPPPRDLDLDLGAVAETAFQVVTVLTQIGAAVQLADWAREKVKRRQGGSVVIRVGDAKVQVTSDSAPDDLGPLEELAESI
jgi:hypothetical protein